MTDAPEHQDWKPLVLKRAPTKDEKNKLPSTVVPRVKDTGDGVSKNVANDFDPAHIGKPLLSTQDLANAIQKARMEKKMNQQDLNVACGFPPGTIRDYENKHAKVIPTQINKMEKVLGVKLPRPKRIQLKNDDDE